MGRSRTRTGPERARDVSVGRDPDWSGTEMASGLMTVVSMVSGKLIPVEREERRGIDEIN